MQLEGITGPNVLGDGVSHAMRLGRTGEIIVTELFGKYAESAFRDLVFTATQTAGVLMTTVAGTTASWSLYNPAGSGKYLSLIRAELVLTAAPGTPVIGAYMLTANTNPNAAATTGTAVTPIPGKVGGTAAAVGRPLTSATLPANPTLWRPLGQKYTGAVTTIPATGPFVVDFDGTALVAPGCTVSMQVLNVDTTNASGLGTWVWQEIPV